MRKPAATLRRWVRLALGAAVLLGIVSWLSMGSLRAQETSELDRVLNLTEQRSGPHGLPADRGAPGLWQRLLKLQTTASALYTTAHPDDEQGGVLTLLSRGRGVRLAMLTLNRGEAGANAIGPELFDGLGLIRTEELLISDRYYGLDDQYFTTLIDYGYSKNLSEALDSWGKENVLRDMVRVIRINRPLVLISRFHGSERDGHGNHETAGVVTQEAFAAAGDPSRFPEQISEEGLRPWQPLKMYRSNLRPRFFFRGNPDPPEERWQVRVDSGRFSPWLGTSYQDFSALGLSFQRSQNSGRKRDATGPYYQFFERVHATRPGPEKETGFFDGIDTSVSGIFRLLDQEPPQGALQVLQEVEESVQQAVSAYDLRNPSAVVPFLARGLSQTRQAIEMAAGSPDARFILLIKERQFMDAIHAALGLSVRATAIPAGTAEETSPFAPDPTMGVVVPGQNFKVEVTSSNPSDIAVEARQVRLHGTSAWEVQGGLEGVLVLRNGETFTVSFDVSTPLDAEISRRYFFRDSIRENRYQIRSPRDLHLPARKAALQATVTYQVAGETVEVDAVVYRREANLPYGYQARELKVAPALAVNVKPRNLAVPLSAGRRLVAIQIELLNNQPGGTAGQLTLEVPEGWSVNPPTQAFSFAEAGERRNYSFAVSIPRLEDRLYRVEAVARTGGREFREGYDTISHRDYDTSYWYHPAVTEIRGIDVAVAPHLRVGYVMGVGDEVPSGIEQLGAQVTLLTANDLATGDLGVYDVIVIGTRAYAVRQDLITYNQRLLDFARNGGNLIVLYQTQEFIPNKWAAHPAELPRGAEEVSEEDSPVRILASGHDAFQRPNQITGADFEGWVEQRGSKFFSQWDPGYTPMIETQDRGQEPQRGGWLIARFGNGYYTYFAYAVHRQLPYGVPGAYRIFANLLSLGKP